MAAQETNQKLRYQQRPNNESVVSTGYCSGGRAIAEHHYTAVDPQLVEDREEEFERDFDYYQQP